MRKIKVLTFIAVLAVCGRVFAGKIAFTEAGASYCNVIDPSYISNNDTGVFDTASFDAKAGYEPIMWTDIYAGAAFHFYMDRSNWQNFYTFFPLYIGCRVNIFPELIVYPSIFAEYGLAFANHHYVTGPTTERDAAWDASYYNFGIGINWNVTDIATLCLYAERPSLSNDSGPEIHIFKSGFAWKIFY